IRTGFCHPLRIFSKMADPPDDSQASERRCGWAASCRRACRAGAGSSTGTAPTPALARTRTGCPHWGPLNVLPEAAPGGTPRWRFGLVSMLPARSIAGPAAQLPQGLDDLLEAEGLVEDPRRPQRLQGLLAVLGGEAGHEATGDL